MENKVNSYVAVITDLNSELNKAWLWAKYYESDLASAKEKLDKIKEVLNKYEDTAFKAEIMEVLA